MSGSRRESRTLWDPKIRVPFNLNREERQGREEKRSTSRSLWFKGKDPDIQPLTDADAPTC
jgi:hypothetical protein